MTNPLKGVFLNDRFYNYEPGSFRISLDLGNDFLVSQDKVSPRFLLGARPEVYTVRLLLSNTYNINHGSSFVGSTTWFGMSRLQDLLTTMDGGVSTLPMTFVTPYGLTGSVIPTGTIDVQPFLADNPQQRSMEYFVDITLESK